MRARENPMRQRHSAYCIAFCSVLSLYSFVSFKGFVSVCVVVSLYERVRYVNYVIYKWQNISNKWATTKSFRSYSICFSGTFKSDKERERELEVKYCTRFEATIAHMFRTISELFVTRKSILYQWMKNRVHIDDGNSTKNKIQINKCLNRIDS